MRNLSIRTRILAGIVIVNLVGMITVMIYLHESYSGGLDVTAEKSAALGVAGWEQLSALARDEFGSPTTAESAAKYVTALKGITGSEYGILIDKTNLDEAAYVAAREKANLPNDWDEREGYVLLAATDDGAAAKMQLKTPSGEIPEMGKIVGVENGACSKTCHGAVEGTGDFWKVRWSDDTKSRADVVFPISNDKGQPIGIVYSVEDISAQANAAKASLLRTMFVIMGGLIISTLLIAWLLNALVFHRLTRMIASIEDLSVRVAGGDFDAQFVPDGSSDEIGQFEAFFAKFMNLVSSTLKSISGQ